MNTVSGMQTMMHLLIFFRFAKHLPAEAAKAEAANPLKSHPNINWIRAYLTWRSRTAQSRLDGATQVAVSTLKKEYQQLLRIIRLSTGHIYDRKEDLVMKSVCRNAINIAL
jgi:gluconate kinase